MRDPATSPEPTIRTMPLAGGSVTILPGDYVSRPDAARMIGVSGVTMGTWARRGVGPKCIKAGAGLHLYSLAEVEAEAARRRAA